MGTIGEAWERHGRLGSETVSQTRAYIAQTPRTFDYADTPTIVGGIIATYSFLKKDAPKYLTGYKICLSFISLAAASCMAYFVAIWIDNQRRGRQAAVSSAEVIAEEDEELMGDLAPSYRYQY